MKTIEELSEAFQLSHSRGLHLEYSLACEIVGALDELAAFRAAAKGWPASEKKPPPGVRVAVDYGAPMLECTGDTSVIEDYIVQDPDDHTLEWQFLLANPDADFEPVRWAWMPFTELVPATTAGEGETTNVT